MQINKVIFFGKKQKKKQSCINAGAQKILKFFKVCCKFIYSLVRNTNKHALFRTLLHDTLKDSHNSNLVQYFETIFIYFFQISLHAFSTAFILAPQSSKNLPHPTFQHFPSPPTLSQLFFAFISLKNWLRNTTFEMTAITKKPAQLDAHKQMVIYKQRARVFCDTKRGQTQ